MTEFLNPYLTTQLPSLGLDYETYGPYVTGVVDDVTKEVDTEALKDIIELLRASSEHDEDEQDENVWMEFENVIIEKSLEEKNKIEEEKAVEEQELAMKMQNVSLSEKAETLARREEEVNSTLRGNEMSEERRKLLERYAYENEEEVDESDEVNASLNNDAKKGDAVVIQEQKLDNRAVAKQTVLEKNQKIRKEYNESKKASKEASVRGKTERNQRKEERRKRAQKGERRR